jgi:hypothetical protein
MRIVVAFSMMLLGCRIGIAAADDLPKLKSGGRAESQGTGRKKLVSISSGG